MNCPFCAESIQDAAVVCRFCGARQEKGEWVPPGSPVVAKGPGFTIKSSGFLIILASLWEWLSVNDPVPLFGMLRGGPVAIGYHTLFGLLFGVIGVGLYSGKWWAVRAMIVGTVIYSIDRLLLVFDAGARDAQWQKSIGQFGEAGSLIDLKPFESLSRISPLLALLGWFLLALYVYNRRSVFSPRPADA